MNKQSYMKKKPGVIVGPIEQSFSSIKSLEKEYHELMEKKNAKDISRVLWLSNEMVCARQRDEELNYLIKLFPELQQVTTIIKSIFSENAYYQIVNTLITSDLDETKLAELRSQFQSN